jgi:hypothetical protein
MNPRNITIAAGAITTMLGVAALLYPALVMEHVLGFAIDPRATENFVRGEVRAIYGGVFTVMGIYLTLAGLSPHEQRGRILFMGAIFLGAGGGRLLGAIIDGSPGLFGWLTAAIEVGGGLLLIVVSQMAEPPAQRSPLGTTIGSTPPPSATAA